MKLKRILSGILAAGIIACGTLAPEALPLNGIIIEAQAASEKPSKPTGFKVENIGTGAVNISWNKVTDADKVAVYRATSKDGKYKNVIEVKSKYKNVKLYDLKEGATYYFKIRTYKKVDGKKVYSDYTSAQKVTILSEQTKNLEATRKKAPLFASYMDFILSGAPMYYDIDIEVKGSSEYFSSVELGDLGTVTRMKVAIVSEKKFAFSYYTEDGSNYTLIVKNNNQYVVIPSMKGVAHTKITSADRKKMLSEFEEMGKLEVPDMSTKGVNVKTSKETYKGKKYTCEKITFDGLEGTVIRTYADTKTSELKYLTAKYEDSEMYIKFNKLSKKVDESIFKIPSDYFVVEG